MLLGPSRVKSDEYVWAKPPSSWDRIDPGTADVVFQQKEDRATISLNTVCDQYQDQTLVELSKSLMLGLDDSEVKAVENVEAGGLPGLRTTIAGKMAAEPIVVSMTVLRSTRCVYDFMLVARPEAFTRHRQAYVDLIQALQVRRDQ